MARPQQLQPGQLNPQSQPVSTFIQQTSRNVAGAARPELLPQTPQLQTSQTGGTTFVQGENSFKKFADDLAEFSPQFMRTAETAGLKFVDWRMDVGEQMAMEQVQRGLAQIDEQTEVAADQRAADNRRLSAVDPQAGWLMRTLDPYQQMGYERGKVKLAGRQIQTGLSAYIAQNSDQIDYAAEDMGMSAIQRLQAEYQLDLENQYGINSGSPGYQKYFAPNLLRAQGRVADQVLDARTRFFESQIGPQAITAVADELDPVSFVSDDIVYYDENNVEVGRVPYMYQNEAGRYEVNGKWVVIKAQTLSKKFKELTARAPLGMAGQIAKDLYVEVSKRYPPGSAQRKVLDAMKGPDGKSFGSKFGYLAQEANSDYYATKAKTQKNEQLVLESEFGDQLRIQLDAGASFDAAVSASLGALNQRRKDMGRPPLTLAEERKLRAYGINERGKIAPQRGPVTTPSVGIPANDPQAATQFLQSINAKSIYDIDVDSARQRLRDIQQAGLPDGEQTTFTQASGRVDQAERAQAEAGTWVKEYGGLRDKQVDALIGPDSESPAQLFGEDRDAATLSINAELNRRMSSALKELSDGKPLTPEQIQDTFSKVWPELRKDIVDGTFPIPGYKDEPSVGTSIPTPVVPKPAEDGKAPELTLGYDLDQVNNMPRRNIRLRNYRKEASPILSAKALIQIVQDAANGRREDPRFTEVWKRAGAPNAWSFIERQLKYYQNGNLGKGGRGWTEEELQRAKQDLLSFVIRDGNRAATTQLARISPSLALLNNWAEMA
jgi:hypothetical protein